ncbi:hypothetical protein [Caulobacter phage Cr30]|uniref:hypothetical protein n=1 Tax=Caulobacter phage Cr30 TaxID=1357714 RepID=UPI0004A9B7F6|nr:hypothetical protein OZ74_gp144 [Caulobacter phage Cr30]AGS81029.1 hypothetical protein [Caulobacter phage Cr30]
MSETLTKKTENILIKFNSINSEYLNFIGTPDDDQARERFNSILNGFIEINQMIRNLFDDIAETLSKEQTETVENGN